MDLVTDKALIKESVRYKSMKCEERVIYQRALIDHVVAILKQEQNKRYNCEKEFETILLRDSQKIVELVF
jgi:polyphosphate kinase 2 (PPK2 family)